MAQGIKKRGIAFVLFGALVVAVVLVSSAQAFLFSKKTEKVEIYPSQTKGEWTGKKNVLGEAEVDKNGKAEEFDKKNSAVYSGGTKDLIVAQFDQTPDELGEKTEDDEIIDQINQSDDEEDEKNKESDGQEKKENSFWLEHFRWMMDPLTAQAKDRLTFDQIKETDVQSVKIVASLAVITDDDEKKEDEIDIDEEEETVDQEKNIPKEDRLDTDETEEQPVVLGETDEKIIPTTDPEHIVNEPDSKEEPSEIIVKGEGSETVSDKQAKENEAENDVEEENIGEWDIDSKVVIWYSVGGSEKWKILDTITQDEISNKENGGYFSWEAPFLEDWDMMKGLKLKFQGVVDGQVKTKVYLDSVWLQAEYDEDGLQCQKEELDAAIEQIKIESEKRDWGLTENPVFMINKGNSFFTRAKNWLMFWKEANAGVKLSSWENKEIKLTKEVDYSITSGEEVKVELFPSDKIIPGRYRVSIYFENSDQEYILSHDFTWGIITLNTDQAVFASGDQAVFGIGVQSEEGRSVCDAKVKMKIKHEDSQEPDELSTTDGTISTNQDCISKNFTMEPDYSGQYIFHDSGRYEIMIEVQTSQEFYEYKDSIDVKKDMPVRISRQAPSRIYPPNTYPVTIKVKAEKSFKGKLVEVVPGIFDITPVENESGQEQEGAVGTFKVQDSKEEQQPGKKWLVWELELAEGEEMEFSYQFKAPDDSPEFYQLGGIKVMTAKNFLIFGGKTVSQEQQPWGMAVDYMAPKAELDVSIGDIENMKGIYPDKVVFRTNDNGQTDIWLMDFQTGEQKNISKGTDVSPDFPVGIKGKGVFWLSADRQTVYFYDNGKQDVTSQSVPEFDPAKGERARVTFEGFAYEVIISADNFYFFSQSTGEVFSDESGVPVEHFNSQYDVTEPAEQNSEN